ncbi:MAG TPA: MBL fold metallo-hydrolase [Solirubrobacteraceae bacterium]|nr:MBL fold metallo-hydrolase [Solirubrobacteraceae bacterium]
MRVEWFGQSAFHLSGPEGSVAIDPFGDMSALSSGRGIQWDYPAIAGVAPELLLVTHEHGDHNGVEAIEGEPAILRSTAGTLESPLGQVAAIASEHDEKAGVERGPNTIFVFTLDGLRIAHMGDFGQRELREEQAAAMVELDLLILPVGGGPTLGGEQAAAIVERLKPRWAVPMHYRTPRIGFLEPPDSFLERSASVERLSSPAFETSELPPSEMPLVVVPAAP